MCVCVCVWWQHHQQPSLWQKHNHHPLDFQRFRSFDDDDNNETDNDVGWKEKRKILKIFTKHARNADKSVCVCFLFVCGNEWRPPWKLNSKSTMAKENATENCHCIRRLWRLERMTVWLFYCTFHLYIYYDKATTGSVPLIVANHRGVPLKH